MFYNIINSEPRSGDSVTVINPRTSESLWEVPVGRETDLNDAVEAARVSFELWRVLPVEERQKYLLKLADELEHRRDEVQPPLAGETGKSVTNPFHIVIIEKIAKKLLRISSQTWRLMILWRSSDLMVLQFYIKKHFLAGKAYCYSISVVA